MTGSSECPSSESALAGAATASLVGVGVASPVAGDGASVGSAEAEGLGVAGSAVSQPVAWRESSAAISSQSALWPEMVAFSSASMTSPGKVSVMVAES